MPQVCDEEGSKNFCDARYIERSMGSDKSSTSQSSRAGLTSHCLVGETFESKVAVRILKGKSVLPIGWPRSLTSPKSPDPLFEES